MVTFFLFSRFYWCIGFNDVLVLPMYWFYRCIGFTDVFVLLMYSFYWCIRFTDVFVLLPWKRIPTILWAFSVTNMHSGYIYIIQYLFICICEKTPSYEFHIRVIIKIHAVFCYYAIKDKYQPNWLEKTCFAWRHISFL